MSSSVGSTNGGYFTNESSSKSDVEKAIVVQEEIQQIYQNIQNISAAVNDGHGGKEVNDKIDSTRSQVDALSKSPGVHSMDISQMHAQLDNLQIQSDQNEPPTSSQAEGG